MLNLQRQRNRKRLSFSLLTTCITSMALLISSMTVAPAPVSAADAIPALNLEAKAAILIEAETGQILYEYNKDELLPPASMAKMMSEYIVLEQIEEGKIRWDDIVTISPYSARTGGSGGLLAKGERYTVEQLFQNMSIFSGNDASVALAEYVAQSEEKFAHMINDKAREFGLSDGAYFINSTGLDREDLEVLDMAPASLPGETQMSAYDAAKIAQRVILDYPDILKTTSIPEAYFKPNDKRYLMENWNWMLESWKGYGNNYDKLFAYEGMDGLKTGSTPRALYCFTGTAVRDGLRLISVVMATPTRPKRFTETKKLLDYGFNNFEKMTAMQPKTELDELKTVKVSKGKEKEVSIVTEKGAIFLVPKGTNPEDFVIEAAEAPKEERVAPIKRGQPLGKVTVSYTSSSGQVMAQEINLVAADDIEKANGFVLFFRSIGNFFKDLFSSIKNLF